MKPPLIDRNWLWAVCDTAVKSSLTHRADVNNSSLPSAYHFLEAFGSQPYALSAVRLSREP